MSSHDLSIEGDVDAPQIPATIEFNQPARAARKDQPGMEPSRTRVATSQQIRRRSLSPSSYSSQQSSKSQGLAAPSSGMKKSASIPEKMAQQLKHMGVDKMAHRVQQELEHGAVKVRKLVRGEHEIGPTVADPMLETLDYDNYEDYISELHLEKDARAKRHHRNMQFLRFFMTVLIAFVTAMLSYGVALLVDVMVEAKFHNTSTLIEHGNAAAAYFSFVFTCMGITAVASLLCSYLAPHARGGGVPYVLAYLNGTNVADYFEWRIVAIKTLALAFTISGGLTLGMEGPFVFIGGGVAMICSHAIDHVPRLWAFISRKKSAGAYTRVIHNIREERIFMAGGMAAGLAVAFSAPIAGVLMALEGSTAFLTIPTVIRIFGCAMFATFFSDLGHAGFSHKIKSHNLVETAPTADDSTAWILPELIFFAVLGVIGGMLGASATWINVKITKWRHHVTEGKWKWGMLEIAIFTFITSTAWFILPYIFSCTAIPDSTKVPGSMCSTRAVTDPCKQLHCGEGYFSEIGSIVYSPSDTISRLILNRSLTKDTDFSPVPLIVYGSCYFFLVSFLYGAHVPGGLFVPSVVIGGVYGRVIGIAFRAWFYKEINPGVYALLGAASMLGGFTRLALPIVIMLIEMTGDATYLLPIMICTVMGKFIADYYVPPIYPQHMAIEQIPVLGEKLNPIVSRLTAKDIMPKGVHSLRTISTVAQIRDTLELTKSSSIPLTNNEGHLAGLMSRRAVTYAIQHAPSYASYHEARELGQQQDLYEAESKMSAWSDTKDYSHTITMATLNKMPDEWINLTPFMDSGPLTARPETPCKRIAALFRRVGLSHLCITDRHNRLLAVITRRHLLQPPKKTKIVKRIVKRKVKKVKSDDEKGDEPDGGQVVSKVVTSGPTLVAKHPAFADDDADDEKKPLSRVTQAVRTSAISAQEKSKQLTTEAMEKVRSTERGREILAAASEAQQEATETINQVSKQMAKTMAAKKKQASAAIDDAKMAATLTATMAGVDVRQVEKDVNEAKKAVKAEVAAGKKAVAEAGAQAQVKAQQVREQATVVASQAREQASAAAQQAREQAQQALSSSSVVSATSALKAAKSKAAAAAESAKSSAQAAKSSATAAAQQAKSSASSAAQQAKSSASSAAQQAKSSATSAAQKVQSSATVAALKKANPLKKPTPKQ